MSTEYVHVADLDDLRAEGRRLVNENGQAIALFYEDGAVRAIDNRCPHMGFPLTQGTVDDGVLTCHWHHARFELACGDTFDPWADDVPTYPVEVRGNEVWVKPVRERDDPPAVHWARRLDTGLEENLRLVLAKSAVGLDDANVAYRDPYVSALEFGTRYRESGWGPGLTIHTALANIRDSLDRDGRRRALYQGAVEVAGDCAGEPPRFAQPAFEPADRSPERLTEWFRECVELRDADGAERVLHTAIRSVSPTQVCGMLYAAATDHRYLDTGHALDFVTKAVESLDHAGWDAAEDVLPTVVSGLANAERAEEDQEWRQPVDLAAVLDDAFEDLPEENGSGEWREPDGFVETLLGDDPDAVVDALSDAVDAGASTTQLAGVVRFAAARRVAQFGTANEFNDWNTVLHTFTYANAVYQGTLVTDTPLLYRGVFDAAASVYLDRFLNTPPARIPDGDADADPEDALSRLLDAFDVEGGADAASRHAADFLAGGGDPDALREALGGALVREDAGFHTFQAVEAAFQGALDSDGDRKTVFLVAAARYLAAHTPTRREREQTFRIAERLQAGESLHDTE
ncbi:Rieske (2Fe-2S) protein [Halocalculus aciditolerans]|uniref:Rieske domain-containing protein n=1 Tax=Halocalculus aciditolerans TaxID=1383812 RepID=A0A830F3X3_9EURY|nr:Rieske (2Fe-2S) protein [Halocalculus aciditolerans]GGL60902.1 hypothetical protein GCM10009039_18880 [Halocalculus aciditolerans]